jgi:hypothetical protein
VTWGRTPFSALGIAIVAVHLAGFVWLASRSRGTELAIAAPARTAASSPAGGPGLVHQRWSTSYRGGYTRSIGATQLVGPFQDPDHPACSGRVVIGQRMLDDSTTSTTTIAGVMRQMIESELRGQDIWPIGRYKRINKLSLAWVKNETSFREKRMLGKAGAPDGFIRAKATVAFDRVEVPVLVALVPQRAAGALSFKIVAEADLDFDNRALQWISDKVGADNIATKIAREQIDDVLVTTFAPPPPFDLGDGQTLQFTYCDGPVDIVDGAYGALPFAVAFGRAPGSPDVLPPRFTMGSRPAPSPSTLLAIDLDVDALDALLYELWRTGWLDKRLAEVGLDTRFNTDPIVTEYLSIRVSPLRLALPPVISPGEPGSLRLAADARVEITDGATTTTGRVYGALDFRFAPPTATSDLPTAVEIGALELSCERDPLTLVPCYGDLVSALRDRGSEFHGALTEAFAKLLADIFVDRRVSAEGLPVDVVIERAVPSLAAGGTVHLELAGMLAPAQ